MKAAVTVVEATVAEEVVVVVAAVGDVAVAESAAVGFVAESVAGLAGVVGFVAAPVESELVEAAAVVVVVGERDS